MQNLFKMPHVTWEFVLENEADIEKLRSKDFIHNFAIRLCEKIGLTVLDNKLIHQFENKENPYANGITAFYILAESGVHIQTWPEYGYGFVDVFSCKNFDLDEAGRFIKAEFGPGKYRRDTYWRGKVIEEFYADKGILSSNLPLRNAVRKKVAQNKIDTPKPQGEKVI